MNIALPEVALVLLIGASGSGKSTFARKHFAPTQVLSSDVCRGMVADDETDQHVTKEAFEILDFIAGKRLDAQKLTVIDATNVQQESRKSLIALAKAHHVLVVGIVFDIAESVCQERNRERPERTFGKHVIHQQIVQLHRSQLKREGLYGSHTLHTPEEVESVNITYVPLYSNRRAMHGPFDIIGDIHGCFAELEELLVKLGYTIHAPDGTSGTYSVSHPEGRTLIFLGDLVDRGPHIPEVLHLVMDLVESKQALCVPGNHDMKLLKALQGLDVSKSHGLAESLAQLVHISDTEKEKLCAFLDSLTSHFVLDGGRLVVAHAGLPESMQGRSSKAVRAFALFGETSGETDEFGLPLRYNWALNYRGKAMVVYGHTPVMQPEWLNNTINIDTGCVFGGQLTTLRYPEKELVSVPAGQVYAEPIRPLQKAVSEVQTAQQQQDELLDWSDIAGKRIIETHIHPPITIREEHAIAAAEAMSRFAVHPKWLIYLPPTISPCETSALPGVLEDPSTVFAYYTKHGVQELVCEEKHMGSRAIVIVCRDNVVARRVFGITTHDDGICYTRHGRRFFEDKQREQEVLDALREHLTIQHFWETFETDWVALDCEIMPWTLKAQPLLEKQYAAVGAAGEADTHTILGTLRLAEAHGLDVQELQTYYGEKQHLLASYREAYRKYCRTIHSLADIRIAPFQILATQGKTYFGKEHVWHMQTLESLCRDSALLQQTEYRLVHTENQQEVAAATAWWEEITAHGGEGMVAKINQCIPPENVQPSIKCRGREYLRIIYGAEYTQEEQLSFLKAKRNLGLKRSLALREFALGVESLERFTQREPLRRVHECVFGILALESEPVDATL